MGFRIQNNIAAMNAHRQLSISGDSMTKSLERLSSGYRINRAADDAAGLAISSSFRANIASFKVASQNASQANSLLQVAEGGMDQITNMLTRLKELSTQAASANVGASERTKINAEGDALISEINRIANSTKYGSTSLLDGTFGATKSATMAVGSALNGTNSASGIVANSYVAYSFSNAAGFTGATLAAVGSSVAEGTWYMGVATAGGSGETTTGKMWIANAASVSAATVRESFTMSAGQTTVAFANLGVTITWTAASVVPGVTTISAQTGALTAVLTVRRTGLSSLSVENAIQTGTLTINTALAGYIKATLGTVTQTVQYTANATQDFDKLGVSFALSSATEGYDSADLEGMSFAISSTGSTGNTFQIGAENNSNNRISLSIGNVTIGVNGLNLAVGQLTTAANAQAMLDTVDAAVSSLSTRRGDIGAAMNRLSYAAANLSTVIENTQAAESVIRDVDMADEMTSFTKNQILQQAGTAMLSQANQAPQLILSLFK